MTAIDEIKSRLDIVDVISQTVQLRRSGKNHTGFCPFHTNTRTPAFVVFSDTGTWRCFGQCNEGGDIFGFVMKKEGWDFTETLKYLAEKAGVVLKPPTPQELHQEEEHSGIRALLEDAVTFYRHNLLNSEVGATALRYLREKRGLRDDTLETFGIGYAPDTWDALTNYFKTRGISDELLLTSGLVTKREDEESLASRGVYDRFRNRIMIPIRDERGRMAGFGGRILNPSDVPKFLNSPQTAIFDKGNLLYGLDQARKAIRAKDQAVLVEGYLDVITLHQAGFTNTVSPMGTALTEAQLRLLKRYTHRMVLALDADVAGEKATLRGLEIARQALDRETEPVFDARGLLAYEARLQADVRVTTLPVGLDPDEVVNRDPHEWEQLVGQARSIVEHVMETLASSRNIDDAKVKTEVAAQVLPLIRDVPDPLVRDTYRQRLARLLKVDERSLLSGDGTFLSQSGRRPRRTYKSQAPPIAEQAYLKKGTTEVLEDHFLGVIMRQPTLVYRIDRALQEAGLERVSYDDFLSGDHQQLIRIIEDSLRQDHIEPLTFVLNSLSLPLMEMIDQLLTHTDTLDPGAEKVVKDLIRTLLEIRRRRLQQNIEHLQYLMKEVQEAGDQRASEYQDTMYQYSKKLHSINRAFGQFASYI